MGPEQVKSTSELFYRTSRAQFRHFCTLLESAMIKQSRIGGVILAGGRATRMGCRDKALEPLHGRALLDYVIAGAAPQVAQLVLSLNHNTERYQSFGIPIVGDREQAYSGPLLGILSAMHWFRDQRSQVKPDHLACFPADVPAFPHDVVSQLASHLEGEAADVAYIFHRQQIQPLFSLWRLDLIERIEQAVASGLYGPKLVFGSLRAVSVECEDNFPGCFENINSPEDLAAAARIIDPDRPA